MLVKDKAAADAAEVLETYWAPGRFPVDASRIAHRMGMSVELRRLREGISGMLRVEPWAVPEIFVDTTDVEPRQRFTIAHEIGHYVERTSSGANDFNFVDKRGGQYDVHEFYADEFAANLLMPADEIERMRGKGAGLVRLAGYFGVSLPAMKLRLRRLGISAG